MLNKKNITALVLGGLLLASCNYVEQPYVNDDDGGGAADCPVPTFPANTNTQRNVLLEEFTGHTCPPCPGAGKIARDLQAMYEAAGKTFVVVSIHAGSLAIPHPAGSPSFTTDFRTEDGDHYANDLFTPSLPYTPVGFINRVAYGSTPPWLDGPDWQTYADLEFAKPLVANLQMIVDYDSATEKACIHVQTEYEASLTSDYYLVVYAIEDSIVDWQTNGPSGAGDPAYTLGADIPDFVHRHVFRDAITPYLGTLVSSGPVAAGTQFVNSISYTFNSAWNKDHVSLIAYIYDSNTKEILQVIEHHLLE